MSVGSANLNQKYIYPGPTELKDVAALKLPRLVLNSPILRFFPLEYKRAFYLAWEQRDNYGGMTHVRSLNGKPPRVYPVGERQYLMRPGVYGEHMLVDEHEITLRTAFGNINEPVNLTDLVGRRQDHLLSRRFNRIEWLCWQLALFGQFIVHDVRGTIIHRSAYPIQRFRALNPWSDRDNATPLEDFSAIQEYGRGKGTDFGRRAAAFTNRRTATHMARNRNQDDLGGKTVGQGNRVVSLPEANQIFTADDLPIVEVYDETYPDENGNEVPYIPDGKVVVFGALNNGETIGNFRFVFNANNEGGEPGPYMKVIDTLDRQVPREVEVHDGFNGGPVIYYPGSIVTMDVGV